MVGSVPPLSCSVWGRRVLSGRCPFTVLGLFVQVQEGPYCSLLPFATPRSPVCLLPHPSCLALSPSSVRSPLRTPSGVHPRSSLNTPPRFPDLVGPRTSDNSPTHRPLRTRSRVERRRPLSDRISNLGSQPLSPHLPETGVQDSVLQPRPSGAVGDSKVVSGRRTRRRHTVV